MIRYVIPWDSNKNIADAYNREVKLLKDKDDWCGFIDRDAMFLHPYFGKHIDNVLANGGQEYDLLSCHTNRVDCRWQILPGVDKANNDMDYHHALAQVQWSKEGHKVENVTHKAPLSGMMFMIKKSSWKRMGGFKGRGMLGVDNEAHNELKRRGMKIGLMKGIYVFHWYRGNNKYDHEYLK